MHEKHVVVPGAGGNIGSHLIPHLARMAGVGKITVVDPDAYERANLMSQAIRLQDVGKSKARVQAEQLHRMRPELQVERLACAIEDAPLGRLRADLLISCLDSRRARQVVNEIAWRLGIVWVDTGVLGAGLLARVNVYVPGPESPCLECAWSQEDYDALEQEYPCGADISHPTNSTSALGGLAAALAAIECNKILVGEMAQAAAGSQVTVDARRHKLEVTSFRRNPACRFDHKTWHIGHLDWDPDALTLREAVDLAGGLGIAGHRFERRLVCPNCGRTRALFGLNRPLLRCAGCRRRMTSPGFDALDKLDARSPDEFLRRTLSQVGIRERDVITLGAAHYEIARGGI